MICKDINTCRNHSILLFNKNGYDIFECNKCHHRFCILQNDEATHLAEVYADSYFFEGRDGYPDYLNEKEILIRHGTFYAKLTEKYIPPGTMLDIGAAAGFIMKGFKDRGWECTGIEPNKRMADYCLNQLKINAIRGSIENYGVDQQYDLVTLIQVIGHLYDLDKALQNITDSLKKGGLLLIECWDRDSIVAKILGKNWHEYSPPSVIHWFTKKTLDARISTYGFEPVRWGRPAKKIGLKHALSLLSAKYGFFKFVSGPLEKILGSKDIFMAYPPVDLFYVLYKKTEPAQGVKT
jgi:SAM-dependent methyltransferase